MRLAIAAYVVPFIFAYQPALILVGSVSEIIIALLTASIGIALLAAGCAGYLFRPISWIKRGLLWLAALLLLLPSTSSILLLADVVGFALGAVIIALEWVQRERIPHAMAESRPVAR
jgi:TRAP-type uncharacterized transport system fused permease subunit